LFKCCTSNNLTRTFVGNAEYQPSATAICQSTAATGSLACVKTIFTFLKLESFTLFCLKQFFDYGLSVQ